MSGSLQILHDELLNCHTGNEWETIFKKRWLEFRKIRKHHESIKNRKCKIWPDISSYESWDLSSVLRTNDVMLLSLQDNAKHDRGPGISIENYLEFFDCIGFSKKKVANYHPFHCEIVDVIESNAPDIEIVEFKWPALTLGTTLFSRAGVIVKAPNHKLVRGIANKSPLYWTYKRRYRPTNYSSQCVNHELRGINKPFRRDIELEDRYVYNADADYPVDLRFPTWSYEDGDDAEPLDGIERIDFLKNRCFTTVQIDEKEFFPEYDYFEEIKEDVTPIAAAHYIRNKPNFPNESLCDAKDDEDASRRDVIFFGAIFGGIFAGTALGITLERTLQFPLAITYTCVMISAFAFALWQAMGNRK